MPGTSGEGCAGMRADAAAELQPGSATTGTAGYAHARQFKRMKGVLRTLRTRWGGCIGTSNATDSDAKTAR
jgi:hypothetical protein